MRRFLLIGLTLLGLAAGVSALAPQAVVQADSKSDICQGVTSVSGSTCGSSGTSLSNLIASIVNVLSAIVGIVAVLMMIFGGFRYITSGGDSAKVSSAKNTIIYAIIGLIVVAFAQFIVQFVLKKSIDTTTKTKTAQLQRYAIENHNRNVV